MWVCHSNQIPDGGNTEAPPQEKPSNLGLDVCHRCLGRTVDGVVWMGCKNLQRKD